MVIVDPLRDLGPYLLGVEKPARYVGGEYGCVAAPPPEGQGEDRGLLRMLIAFPDLYEIGMSNQALRILYKGLNAIPGVFCDRAFAPAPDFEALLAERGLPLYGLDTGISLGDLDILCFTLGYELGFTGVLTMLKAASIPLGASERTDRDPIVIMGGPCVSNPLPYQAFIDAFWIGEAEDGFFDLTSDLAGMKKAGEGRGGLLARMASHPSVWMKGKERAIRAIDTGFAQREARAAVFPVPSMKVVQHHGSVEIMRGCPNGCRFCHAGIWYRPMRQKSAAVVQEEAAAFIEAGGYREISLSSLSTGDYRHIDALVEELNRKYGARHISFQLPSLKVSTFSLPLLEKVSAVRKSGLTFAVETPAESWQMAINKRVSRDNVTAILREARKNGWRGAKFYFMIGLPPAAAGEDSSREEEEIVDFILDIARRTGMHFNISLGTFIPKPHTPYQWAAQLDEGTARKKLDYIRGSLRTRGHKVSLHDPFLAVLEGLISRGDGRVGELLEEAFRQGCRLDAWDDYVKRDLWRSLLEKNAPLVAETLSGRDAAGPLPWDCIDPGVSVAFLKAEAARSAAAAETAPCGEVCPHPCGICPRHGRITRNGLPAEPAEGPAIPEASWAEAPGPARPETADAAEAASAAVAFSADTPAEVAAPIDVAAAPANAATFSVAAPAETAAPEPRKPPPILDAGNQETFRILFSFAKDGGAIFLPHLSVLEVFSMAMIRAGLPVSYSQGFNPLPKIDFAAPLAIGVSAGGEIATLDTREFCAGGDFQTAINSRLPPGIRVVRALNVRIPRGMKKHSAASLLWGFIYEDQSPERPRYIPAREEREYRKTALGGTLFGLHRKETLAQSPNPEEPGISYFTAYRALYPFE